VSRQFVLRWTQSPNQDMTCDDRGWKKGTPRKWTATTKQRIRRLHIKLSKQKTSFFTGASAIDHLWRQTYTDEPPPLRTIGQIMKDLGLTSVQGKKRNKGAARYLCYPEYTIYTALGGRVIEADFVGKKFITGRTAPIHFAGFSAKKKPKIRWFQRTNAETADCLIAACEQFFLQCEKPTYLKIDNGAAMSGSGSGKRNISRTMAFLLNQQITPIFAVPKRPFSQASIEGNNSVFSRNFWNRRTFTSLKQIDKQLEWFNISSREYYQYEPPTLPKKKKTFVPMVHFLRQVQEDTTKQRMNGYIDVLNERITLPKSYIKYFVLATWNLSTEQLSIHFEKQEQSLCIKSLPFTINTHSKYLLNCLM